MRTHHPTEPASRDELRRALADADTAHRAAMPGLRATLRRLLSPESPERHLLTREEKAGLLGVPMPARRAFLRSSGLAVVGAVAVAACSGDDDPAETGRAPADSTTTTEPVESGPTAGDVDLAVAAVQIENTAVAAYTAVAEARSADLRAAGVADAAILFRDHHLEHAGALNGLLTDNGAAAVPEDQFFAGITLPTADDIATLPITDIAAFARGLENQAAQTYITAIPRLSLPALRQSLMSIGSIEAKHVTAFDMILGGGVGGYAATAELVVGGNYPTGDTLLAG
jgi:hypothetical protein